MWGPRFRPGGSERIQTRKEDFLVHQCRMCLPVQGTWVLSLVWKIPHAVGQLSPCTTTTGPCTATTEATHPKAHMLRDERSHHNEKTVHTNERVAPLATARRKPTKAAVGDPVQPKKQNREGTSHATRSLCSWGCGCLGAHQGIPGFRRKAQHGRVRLGEDCGGQQELSVCFAQKK